LVQNDGAGAVGDLFAVPPDPFVVGFHVT
jgi:hypothetical protein